MPILDDTSREGLLTLVSARIDEERFGLTFPNKCGDGYDLGDALIRNARIDTPLD